MKDIKLIIKSPSLERAYNEHLTEVAAAGTEVTAGDLVKDIMTLPYPHMTREIATFYDVPKGGNNVIIPIMNTVTTSGLTSGDYGAIGSGVFTFATITVDKDFGVNFQWDRNFAERANWDVMGPFVQNALKATEDKLMNTLCTTLATQAGIKFTIAATLTWANITAGLTSLAVQNYNCDCVVMHPTKYGELLQLQQFIDASYMGSDRNIKTGIIDTQLGMKFISTTKCPVNTILFLDTGYAAAVGMRRDGLVEEYQYPDTNKYGVVVSEVFGVIVANSMAVCKGTI